MAFLRKKTRVSLVLMAMILMLLLIGSAAGIAYYIYQNKLAELKTVYDDKTEQLQFELYELNRQVFVPKEEIRFGTVLAAELFEQKEMKLAIPQELLADESDMGKMAVISLPAGAPVMKASVVDGEMADDLRVQEYNMFLMQTNQMEGDFVDIRIFFPNGENYIVLGKKQLKELNLADNIARLWLDETEIHHISSAIIDAYLHPGTKIYVSTYIQPETQAAAIPFYPPNPDVLDLMRNDPNILKKASDTLAREARAILESHLNGLASDDISKVTTGVNTEISKNNEWIKSNEDKLPEKHENNGAPAGSGQNGGEVKNLNGTDSYN